MEIHRHFFAWNQRKNVPSSGRRFFPYFSRSSPNRAGHFDSSSQAAARARAMPIMGDEGEKPFSS
jgi:hypothetical protein